MKTKYKHLLSPLKVREFTFKNRMISSNSLPHFLQGPEPYPAQSVITHYANRAKSGAAVVSVSGVNNYISEKQYKMDMDMAHFNDWDLYNTQCQNYLAMLADAIHYHQSIACMCLFVGPPAYYTLKKYDNAPAIQGKYNGDTGDAAVPFHVPFEDKFTLERIPAHDLPDKYDIETLEKIADSYAEQCSIIRYLDFEMINIHMCYRGNLPAKFFSPITNKRTDEFGGSLENRMRFPLMVLERVRKAVGENTIIEIQWSTDDLDGGYTREDTVAFLNEAKKYVDIVQLRGSDADHSHPTGFNLNVHPYLDDAVWIKERVPGLIVSTIGGYQDPEIMDNSLADGKADLFAMARAWISDPEFGKKVLKGEKDEIVPCLRCNKCHGRSSSDPMVSVCSVNPLIGIEHMISDLVTPVERKKSVAIIGGGPAGMRCAIYLANRGHDITIYESSDRLGGAISHSDYVSFKWPLQNFKNYLISQAEKIDSIKIELNHKVTPEEIEGKNYDAVIVSIGAEPIKLNLPGIDTIDTKYATYAFENADKIKNNVVIIGGGEVGVECGMHLAQQGKNVTVLEMRDELAPDATKIHYRSMFVEAWESLDNFHGITGAKVTGIEDGKVCYVDAENNVHSIQADQVILSVGMKSKDKEALDFYGTAPEFYMIGDCRKPATVQQAMRQAFAIAHTI